MAWRVFAAMAIGQSHADTGQPCQDACAYRVVENVLCAVVCDGAGSALWGHLGAQHIAATMVEQLAARLAGGQVSPGMKTLDAQRLVEELVHNARQELLARAVDMGCALSDLATTLVGAVVAGDGGFLFHIGDGVAVARPRSATDPALVSLPENGEYCNETFFVTGDTWSAHLRITGVDVPLRGLVLMSDGSAPFAMLAGCRALSPPFMDPIDRFLDSVETDAGNRALTATLNDPRTHRITPDDKTLVIAQWRPPLTQEASSGAGTSSS